MSEFDSRSEAEQAEEELFERLLERYDEASALGLPPALPRPDELTPERFRELERLTRRIDLVNHAARRKTLLSSAETSPAEQPDPFAGEMIGRFRVLHELGRGGYGIVFLAYDSSIGRLVAVKLPRPEVLVSPELRARFLREAQAAGRIDHPHVLPVHEAAEDAGMCYLVTPFCRGLSLAEWFAERGPVPPHDVARLGAALADALACAHQAGVLHRDIKPANILLDLSATEVITDRGLLKPRRLATFVAKLTDFGLAKLAQSSELETRTGTLIGTPTYMAPEQVTGRYADVRTDVYSLGVVMYELLTGKLPAEASAAAGLPVTGADQRTVPPRKLQPSIPRDLEAVVLKCLEFAPAERYATAAALADDLGRFLAGKSTAARPAGILRKIGKAARRRPAATVLCLLLAILLAGLVAGDRWYAARLSQAQAVLQSREYARDIRLAANARRQGKIQEAQELLAQYETGQPGAELRGLEWYWLRHAMRRPRHVLKTQHGEAYGVTFAPAGDLLYSGGKDGVIRVWNVSDGTPSHELRGHEACVNQLGFSPDGTTLASVSCDGTVRLWDVARREAIRVLVDSGVELTTLAFAHHHPWLAVDTHRGLVQVWNTETGQQIAELGTQQADHHVDAVAFHPDDQFLAASFGRGGTTGLWNTSTWQQVRQHSSFVTALAFVGDGSRVVLAPRDWLSDLMGWNVATGQRLMHIGRLPTAVHSVAGMRHQEVFFAGGQNGSIRGFNLYGGTKFFLPGGESRVQSLSLTGDDRLLASADYEGNLRVWDLQEDRWPVTLDSAEPAKQGFLSADGNWLAVNDARDELFLWDCQSRSQVSRLAGFRVAGFSPSGRILIGTNSRGHATAVEVPSLKLLPAVDFPANIVSASVSRNDRFIALLAAGGGVEVIDLEQSKVVLRTQLPVASTPLQLGQIQIGLTDDGSQLIVVENGKLAKAAIQVATGGPSRLPDRLDFLAQATVFPSGCGRSPDGRWQLSGRAQLAECALQNVTTGVISNYLTHNDLTDTHAWAPDGRRIFLATRVGSLVVIDTVSGEQLCELDSPLEPIRSPLVCTPDGERILAFTTDESGPHGFLQLWRAPRAAPPAYERSDAVLAKRSSGQ